MTSRMDKALIGLVLTIVILLILVVNLIVGSANTESALRADNQTLQTRVWELEYENDRLKEDLRTWEDEDLDRREAQDVFRS